MDDRSVMRYLPNDNDNNWVCQFCDHPFPWEVLPQTFRHHLTTICESAPEDVKQAAQIIEEDEFSVSVEGHDSNFNAQTEESWCGGRVVEAAECSRSVNWEPTRILDASENDDSSFAGDTEGNIVQRSNKRQRSTPDALPIAPEVEVLEAIQETGESTSLTKFPVGDAFGKNVEKILSWLMDDQVLRVGIYGMGGVGKTTLMRHIQTLLEGQNSFKVYWITVSQDFSIFKLQNLIAKEIGLNFANEEDEVKRAKSLAQAMQAKRKCVLILDDLWNYFDADEVGIPVGVNMCKLVLTTRLLPVCRQMDCSESNTIQLQALSEEEAWILFTQGLGNYKTEVEELAGALCRKCAGLPLGIKVMARSMKEICDVHTLRSTLEELHESKVSKGHQMQEDVFSVLKSSNDIEGIPSGHTSRCPNLPTLLLCRNHGLKTVSDSFFVQFPSLKILDLTSCYEIKKLPGSISDLVNLTALLLCVCRSLVQVPSLAKLLKLEKLDLNGCEKLKEMPEGVRFLLKLKYLDLSDTGIEEIGSGIIAMLFRLQVLKLCDEYGNPKVSVRGSAVGELRKLETLHCRFSNVGEFVHYMKSREKSQSQQSLTDYSFFIGSSHVTWLIMPKLGSRKFVSIEGEDFTVPLALPTNIETLRIYSCSRSLYKRLFPPSLLASLLNLQEIHVVDWSAMEEIFAMNEGENGEERAFPFSNYSTHSISNNSLLNLKQIEIGHCDKLKKLFPPSLLPNLHNLQTLSVVLCKGMEEIFSTDQEEEGQALLLDQPNLIGLHLPRLTSLTLRELPELRSIYKGAIICHSLQVIELVECQKLKRIPLPLPQPSLQRIQFDSDEWWDSVQWGSAEDKKDLESLPWFKIFREWLTNKLKKKGVCSKK